MALVFHCCFPWELIWRLGEQSFWSVNTFNLSSTDPKLFQVSISQRVFGSKATFEQHAYQSRSLVRQPN